MVKTLAKYLNRILSARLILFAYPGLILFAMGFWLFYNRLGKFEVICIIATYYVCNITVGVGLHRLWSHNTFALNKYLECVLCLLAAGTLQTPILIWASDHAKHHAFTDTDKDPHSPLTFGGGVKGFLWSHIGWMLKRKDNEFHKPTVLRLSKNPLVVWQMRYYSMIAIFMNVVFTSMLGFILGSFSLNKAASAFIFCGVGRILQQHATFCINSVTHFLGKKTYYKGTAGDIGWMSIFLLGENYHNFHHAFPTDYRNGPKWYHLDAHKWIIFALSKMGLAKNLIVTNDVRIQSATNYLIKTHLSQIQQKCAQIVSDYENNVAKIRSAIPKNIQKTIERQIRHCKTYLNTYDLKSICNVTKKEYRKLVKNLERRIDLLEKHFLHYSLTELRVN